MTTDTIKAIQKQIVVKLEAGEDVSGLTKRLAKERAKIAARAEIEQLGKIADERRALRNKAEVVKVKVQKQSEAIDAFLKLRDTLVSQLQPIIEPMAEMARMQTLGKDGPSECYIFNDMVQFAGAVNTVPQGYLSANFGCPFLEMADGKQDARDKASEAYYYLLAAHGILASFQKGISMLPLRPAEGLVAIGNETEAGSCIVCSHAEVETINGLLRQGKPLREIENEFDVSRSSLSRHKNNYPNTRKRSDIDVETGFYSSG